MGVNDCKIIELPKIYDPCRNLTLPISVKILLQLLIHYVDFIKGTDVDLTRSLAKSATVE